MPSEAAKRKKAQKKAQKQASSRSAQMKKPLTTDSSKNGEATAVSGSVVNGGASPVVNGATCLTSRVADVKLSQRSCTGQLCVCIYI